MGSGEHSVNKLQYTAVCINLAVDIRRCRLLYIHALLSLSKYYMCVCMPI